MNRSISAILILLMGLSLPGISLAANLADIQIHGFVGQGYLKSSDNNYLGNSEKGSFNFNEIGLNVAVPLTDNLHFGAQLFSQNLGDFADSQVVFDWAFIDYSWQDWLGFRAGKIKTPFGLYNRVRNVDMLRTFVLLPQSVYPEAMRNYMVAFYGADIYGTYSIGRLGYLDYELFMGTLDESGDVANLANFFHILDSDLSLFNIDIENADLNFKQMYGGMLFWNTPLPGFRIGGSLIWYDMELVAPLTISSTGYFSTDIVSNGWSILSAEYEIGDLTFAAEYYKMDMDMEIQGQSIQEVLVGGWYVSASWNLVDWLSLGGYYMEYYPDLDDKDGKELAADGVPEYRAWQKEIVASAKFNINEFWCVKLETHFIDGTALVPANTNPEGTEKDWVLYAVKTSLNF